MKPTTDPNRGFIAQIIRYAADNPMLVLLIIAGLGFAGYRSLRAVPLDAIPDLSDAQVIVLTEWPGRSPDLMEDQITYPLSTALLSAPGVKFVRGQSFIGLSFVYVIFDDDTDLYWARSRVLEYLSEAQDDLPDGVNPQLGPDATGVGWVFQYALVDRTGQHDLAELRSMQDWDIRFALEQVEGVSEVASIGGFVKQYDIRVDPEALLAYDIPLDRVIDRVRESNQEVSGRLLEMAGHEFIVRGRGYIESVEDLETVPLKVTDEGVPVRLADVAEIELGPAMRRGIAELDGEGETVGGIVVMRYGENAMNVIDRVKRKLEDVRASLPQGVELVVTYDRSELIERSIDTLRRTLIEEMIIVSIAITVFLLHVRSALIPIVVLPIAVLLSFIPMAQQQVTANIMSLGGIAVAIGAMVDASIVIIENIHKKLEELAEDASRGDRREAVIEAMQEVGPSIFFSLLVITVSFLPVFALQATEGRLFRPLALTKTYSMGWAAVLAVTAVPALAALLIRGKLKISSANPINRWLVAAYAPVVRFVVRHRWLVVAGAVAMMIFTIPAYQRLGREFMPPLNEGSILYMPTSPPGMSVTEAADILHRMDRKLKEFPEVQTVFGKIGRARTATDPAPLSMAETTIILKPRDQWREGMTWDKLVAEMDAELQVPGMPNNWWMPIQTRTEMLATGIRGALGIKVFGSSIEQIEQTAIEIERSLTGDPRTADLTRNAFAERLGGGYYVDIIPDRVAASRYGLTVGDVNMIVQAAIGGMVVDQTIEGRERYPIQIRYQRHERDNLAALERVIVPTPTGEQVPLSYVADIRTSQGPPMIRSEGGRLVGFVFVDVKDVPIADYVEKARQVVADEVKLPSGVWLEWAGQFKYLQRANERLLVVVPITLLIVLVLLYLNTKSIVETLIVLLAVPFSLVGAIWLLYLLDYNMSVAVWVGIIALAGLDAETGVVMMLYLTLAHRDRVKGGRLNTFSDLEEGIVEGAAHRIRPKLMTVLTTFIALLPLMLSDGTGADLMKRIAAPMVGGLATSFLLELTVYPALFAIWKRRTVGAQATLGEVMVQ